MPKLYNYAGKRFEIHDVMGVFERDQDGKLKIIKQNDLLLDMAGNMVNERGYIINESGDICSRAGPVLFTKD